MNAYLCISEVLRTSSERDSDGVSIASGHDYCICEIVVAETRAQAKLTAWKTDRHSYTGKFRDMPLMVVRCIEFNTSASPGVMPHSAHRLWDIARNQDIKPPVRKPKVAKPIPPKILTLCGSTRFKEAFEAAMKRETLKGNIVLTVGMFGYQEGLDPNGPVKAMLDQLHFRKIDISAEILVLNVGGYIGHSTRNEIDYAIANGKKVRYLEEHPEESRDTGLHADRMELQ